MLDDDDDVWGSDSEGEGGRHISSELDHEWQARQNQFHTLGYRDGVEAGKNSSVQEGFNLGYAEATVAGFNWGVARGLTTAFAALTPSVKEKLVSVGEARGRLETLDRSIHSISFTEALRSFYRDLNKTLEVGLSGPDAVLGSRNVQEVRTHGLASQAECPLESRDEPGVVSMAGLNRLPESYSAGVWEVDDRHETEQISVVDCSGIETGRRHEHVQQPDESSVEDYTASLLSDTERVAQVTPVGSAIVLKESRSHEDDKSSSLASSAAGKSELEELEQKVRNEFQVASIKICDVLVGVQY